MNVVAFAPAKVILFGEHFVVENEPAIAAALNLRSSVSVSTIDEPFVRILSRDLSDCVSLEFLSSGDIASSDSFFRPLFLIVSEIFRSFDLSFGLDIVVDSEVPVGMGLGSSASVYVALAAALLKIASGTYVLDDVVAFASKGEVLAHGRPSGIDPTISAYGGIVVYRKSEGIIPLKPKSSFPIVVGLSGGMRSTAVMVERVLSLKDRYSSVFDPLYHAAGHLSIEAARLVESGDLRGLGELMNINHGLLSSIGVSTLELERLVYSARDAGAYGAKITGAGGGGAMIALCDDLHVEAVVRSIESAGGRALVSKISSEGVSVHEK